MKKFLLIIVPFMLQAQNLKEILLHAMNNNEQIMAKEYATQASKKTLQAKESSYFPTLDIGGLYKRDDDASPLQPGDVYSGYAKVSLDIYDGGAKSANIAGAKSTYEASEHERLATQKNLALKIVQEYFSLQTLQASLQARQEAENSLAAQLERMKRFLEARLATSDDVERIQASYDTNNYQMQSLRFEILALKKSLELESGLALATIEASKFQKGDVTSFDNLSTIDALGAQERALLSYANAMDSYYYPNIKIEDTYTVYGYDREDAFATQLGAEPLSEQNTLMLSVSMRLVDFGMIAKTRESQELVAQSIATQKSYAQKEQMMQQELALSRIQTAKLRIKSAASALESAQSAFVTIEQKYNSGIVDYVTYLDTLTQKTEAKALYEASLNELEVAYAMYYFYAGKKIEEYVE
jgi:outer membrane protein TolC